MLVNKKSFVIWFELYLHEMCVETKLSRKQLSISIGHGCI